MGGSRFQNSYYVSNDGVANALNQGANTLNNVAWVMLSKMKTPEELELLRERAAASGASARLHNLQATALENEAADRAAAGDNLVRGATGMTMPQVKAFRDYTTTGRWADVPVAEGLAGPTAPGSAQAHGITDAMMMGANAADAAYAMSRGKNINPDNVAKAVRGFMQQSVMAPVMAGAAAPGNALDIAKMERVFDSNRPIFEAGNNGVVVNNITGTVDTSNPMARASIGATNALAGERSAAAGAHNADRDLLVSKGKPVTATIGGQQVTGPVSVMAPVMGGMDRTAATNASRERVADTNAGAKGANGKDWFKALNKDERDQVIESIAMSMPEGAKASMIDRNVMNAVKSWAAFYMRDPKSPARGNPQAAVAEAINQVTGGKGVEISGMYGWREVLPKGGGKFVLDLPVTPAAPVSGGGVAATLAGGAVQPGQGRVPTVNPGTPASGVVPDYETWVAAARKANPGATDDELKSYYIKKYGSA